MARSKYEIRAQKELEAEGYIVDYKIRPRFPLRNYNTDYFGLFDLIALKQQEGFVRWIAIKGVAGGRNLIIAEIEAVKFPPGNSKEIWYISKTKKLGERWIKKILA
jgi:hypothetical protein